MAVDELLRSADPIERAVVISLFTWRRAEGSDPVDDAERYGYWGDAYPDVPKDRIGSRLWLLRRRALVAQTVRDAERYAREALAWLVDDAIVQSVEVTATRVGIDRMPLFVVLTLDQEQRQLTFDDVMEVLNVV